MRTRVTALLVVAALAASAPALFLSAGCELVSLDYLQEGPFDATTDSGAPDASGSDAGLDAGLDAAADAADAADAGLPYVVFYHFDHDTLDSSGHAVTGTLLGQASVDAPGVRGSALSCSHAGDALTFPASSFLPETASFSVAFFFRLTLTGDDGGPASTENTFFWKGSAWDNSQDPTPGTAIGYWTFLPYNLNAVANDGAGDRDGFLTSGYRPQLPNPPLADGQFHHAAYVVDRGSSQLLLYSDGVLQATSVLPASGDGGPYGSLDSPLPGQLCAETNDLIWPLDGALDEFMIVSRALTAAEVAGLARLSD